MNNNHVYDMLVVGGGDFATVLQTYSIVTIGDGLVSQLPA